MIKKNGKLASAVVTMTRFRGSSPNENGRLLGSELHLSAIMGKEVQAQVVYRSGRGSIDEEETKTVYSIRND